MNPPLKTSSAAYFFVRLQFTLGTAALSAAGFGVDWRLGLATVGSLFIVASRFWRHFP